MRGGPGGSSPPASPARPGRGWVNHGPFGQIINDQNGTWRYILSPGRPPARSALSQIDTEPAGQARLRLSISRKINGVKISCMASSILPPGTTMLLGRDMNESCSIDSR